MNAHMYVPVKQPPPVPARKSVHRSNSPSHLHSQASECNSKPLPPPVSPRSKSLGRTAISVSQDLVEGMHMCVVHSHAHYNALF